MEFKVRRVLDSVTSSGTLNHGDHSRHGWSSPIRVCTLHYVWGCRVLGLTLLSVGLRSTLRPVHSQAWWAVSSLRVCKVLPSRVPEGNGVRKIDGPLLGDWSSFC